MAVLVRGLSECERNLKAASAQANVASQRSVAAAGMLVLRGLKDRMSGSPGRSSFWGRTGGQGDTLGARTGGTRNRLQGGRVMGAGGSYWTSVGSPDQYVKHAEEGGELSTSGFFRIPTAAAQTGAGVDRLAGQSIKGQPGFRLIRTKAGKLWGVKENYTGRGFFKSMTLMYLFVKNITIRGRHVFARTRTAADPQVRNIAGLEVQTIVRVGNGGA
jgi:hypothetical protein